jgi:hypothetical protein
MPPLGTSTNYLSSSTLHEPMRPSVVALVLLTFGAGSLGGQLPDSVSLSQPQQYDLLTDGQAFLLREAANASFFMLGELHGENEIPSLIRNLWPSISTTSHFEAI